MECYKAVDTFAYASTFYVEEHSNIAVSEQ